MTTKKHILIVDDETCVRDPAQRFLQSEGYRVRAVADAEEALASLQASAVADLFLVDAHLPGMSGAAFCETILQSTPNAHCVLTSGCDHEEVFSSNDLRTRVSFLPKPWTLQELADTVRDALYDHIPTTT